MPLIRFSGLHPPSFQIFFSLLMRSQAFLFVGMNCCSFHPSMARESCTILTPLNFNSLKINNNTGPHNPLVVDSNPTGPTR